MDRPVLVTGAAGFAGSHLLDLLRSEPHPLIGWRRPPANGHAPRVPLQPVGASDPVRWVDIDLLDRQAVSAALGESRPSAIYHCAGAAHVGSSWESTRATLADNVLATHYLLDAIRQLGFATRVFIPGSGLVYRPSASALTEDDPLAPASPYGISKLAQERLGLRATEDGIPAIVSRSFNHIGPRQDPAFAASGFARQVAWIEAGHAPPLIEVGNLGARREVTDVRDTVRAYRLLMQRGRPGCVYNVCSGRAHAIAEVLDALLTQAHVRIEVRVDPARLRPHDNPILVGDPHRIQTEIGWRPQIPFEQTLADLLQYWRAIVAKETVR